MYVSDSFQVTAATMAWHGSTGREECDRGGITIAYAIGRKWIGTKKRTLTQTLTVVIDDGVGWDGMFVGVIQTTRRTSMMKRYEPTQRKQSTG